MLEVQARHSIRTLLKRLEELSSDFSQDLDTALVPFVESCLKDGAAEGPWLLGVCESFGWDGQRFTRPLDLRVFASRLKALMYDSLQQKGQGSFAVVYKVCLLPRSLPERPVARSCALIP